MKKKLPSQETLQYLFYYNPKTGKLYSRFKGAQHPIGREGYLHTRGYRNNSIKCKEYKTHRLIWMYVTGNDPGDLGIDHKDRNKSNNRMDNLRLATDKQNAENNSGKGYCWEASSSKWIAYIHHNNKQHKLGRFKNETDARAAYVAAKLKYHTHLPNDLSEERTLQAAYNFNQSRDTGRNSNPTGETYS